MTSVLIHLWNILSTEDIFSPFIWGYICTSHHNNIYSDSSSNLVILNPQHLFIQECLSCDKYFLICISIYMMYLCFECLVYLNNKNLNVLIFMATWEGRTSWRDATYILSLHIVSWNVLANSYMSNRHRAILAYIWTYWTNSLLWSGQKGCSQFL